MRSSDVGVPVQRGIPGAACGPAHAPERRRGLARRLPGPSAALPVHESGSAAGATATQEQVCMDYICAEAPLFLDTPAILGVPSSLNCYHQSLPLAEMLYARGSGLRASRNQGHAIVTPDGSPPNDRDRSARGPVLCVGIGFLTPSQNYEPASLSARYGPLPAPKPGSSPRMHCAHRCSRIGVFP